MFPKSTRGHQPLSFIWMTESCLTGSFLVVAGTFFPPIFSVFTDVTSSIHHRIFPGFYICLLMDALTLQPKSPMKIQIRFDTSYSSFLLFRIKFELLMTCRSLKDLFLNSVATFSTILNFTKCSFKNLNQILAFLRLKTFKV